MTSNIANAMREVARHAQDRWKSRWKAVSKILAYLNNTQMLGLTFRKGINVDLVVYADSDYARNKEIGGQCREERLCLFAGAAVS